VHANICIARPKKGLPKHTAGKTSVKETASSVAVNNDGTFEGLDIEVEVIECAPGESSPSAKGSALSPSASVLPFKGKGKAKDSEEELEDVEDENMHLREENACLYMSILSMRMPSRLTYKANKLFNMSQEWADFEKHANAVLN
jgi:hypothetical protein